jgi:hypothetical protein
MQLTPVYVKLKNVMDLRNTISETGIWLAITSSLGKEGFI